MMIREQLERRCKDIRELLLIVHRRLVEITSVTAVTLDYGMRSSTQTKSSLEICTSSPRPCHEHRGGRVDGDKTQNKMITNCLCSSESAPGTPRHQKNIVKSM